VGKRQEKEHGQATLPDGKLERKLKFVLYTPVTWVERLTLQAYRVQNLVCVLVGFSIHLKHIALNNGGLPRL
jgi:hypothetical protein